MCFETCCVFPAAALTRRLFPAGQAAADGIASRNDVAVIGRLQKHFPYSLPDVSQRFGFCAQVLVRPGARNHARGRARGWPGRRRAYAVRPKLAASRGCAVPEGGARRQAADKLSADQKQECADHFVFLLLRRSLNQPACTRAPCTAVAGIRNPSFDTCLNPILSDDQASPRPPRPRPPPPRAWLPRWNGVEGSAGVALQGTVQ